MRLMNASMGRRLIIYKTNPMRIKKTSTPISEISISILLVLQSAPRYIHIMPYKDPTKRREMAKIYSAIWRQKNPERSKEVSRNAYKRNKRKAYEATLIAVTRKNCMPIIILDINQNIGFPLSGSVPPVMLVHIVHKTSLPDFLALVHQISG